VGDHRDLDAVERLATGTGKAAHDARVREAVESCLPALRERSRIHTQSQRLLRASASASGDDALLRPAPASAAQDPAVLLRTAGGEG